MITNYSASRILNKLWNGATLTQPGTYYFGFSSTTPSVDGSNVLEPTVGAYARVAVPSNGTNWSTATSKTTPVNADEFVLADSAASSATKKTTLAQIVTVLKTLIATDTLASPTDVTTNNATTSFHGFLKKLSGGTVDTMRGDGTWANYGLSIQKLQQFVDKPAYQDVSLIDWDSDYHSWALNKYVSVCKLGLIYILHTCVGSFNHVDKTVDIIPLFKPEIKPLFPGWEFK